MISGAVSASGLRYSNRPSYGTIQPERSLAPSTPFHPGRSVSSSLIPFQDNRRAAFATRPLSQQDSFNQQQRSYNAPFAANVFTQGQQRSNVGRRRQNFRNAARQHLIYPQGELTHKIAAGACKFIYF